MTPFSEEHERIDRWLLDVAEATASPSETEQINDLLRHDPALRASIAQKLMDDSLLFSELQAAAAESIFHGQSMFPVSVRSPLDQDRSASAHKPSSVRASARIRGLTSMFIGGFAAAMLVGLGLAWLTWSKGDRQVAPVEVGGGTSESSPFENETSEGFAILTRAVGVKWSGEESPIRVDQSIGNRRISIATGLLQLEFFSGATIVLEGPAELQIVSAMRCECRQGKLRAEVPPQAIGFTVATSTMDVVDRGTEFAMQVERGGNNEIHVLNGEVAVHSEQSKNQRIMKMGEAARVVEQGELIDVALDRDKFQSISQLKLLDERQRLDRHQLWARHRDKLAKDPTSVLYFDFSRHETSDRQLPSALSVSATAVDGAIVGCRWTDGRFVGKQALEFKKTSDRVRVNVPGEFKSLTLMAWLRIEGFDQWYSSLILSDGYRSGHVHWQLTQRGLLKLSIGPEQSFATAQILSPSDLGRWVHLAAVYDAEQHFVRQYLDGEMVMEKPIANPQSLKLGAAEIGNWNSLTRGRHAIRSLNGLIDEFAIFSRPFAAQEVKDAFEAGKVNP